MPQPKLPFISDYSKGLRALLLAVILLLSASWFLNLKPTYDLYKANKKYKTQLRQSLNAENEIEDLKLRLESLDKTAIKSYDRDVLLESVAIFCKSNNLLIRNFPASELSKKSGVEYITNLIEVEGEYKEILGLAYMLEHEKMLGAIASLNFVSYEDRLDKKTRLRGSIILRNIKS